MALVRYEPLNLLDRFQRDLNRLGIVDPAYNDSLAEDGTDIAVSSWRPAVDIKEDDNGFVITADIPGVDPKDIEVTMENGVLTIKGERVDDKEEERQGYKRVERTRGSFYRRFSLPDTANAEKIEANGRHGVLEITIPKNDKLLPRRISVKS